MVRVALLLLVCAVSTFKVAAQSTNFRVMQRVDTAHPQVGEVLLHWLDSLSHWSTPQNWYGQHLYRPTTQSIVRDWFFHVEARPTVLSVEYDGGGYAVRTLFTTMTSGDRDLPLGILRCRFVPDEKPQAWVIEDIVDGNTRYWDTTVVDPVTFVHAPVYIIDTADVRASIAVVEAASERFDVEMPSNAICYIVASRDELTQLLGIEYYAFPPSALSFPMSSVIVKSYDASLSHEMVHVLLAEYAQAHPVLREGLATLLGGSGGEDFRHVLEQYVRNRTVNSTPSFIQLFTATQVDQTDTYVLGALLCKAILRTGGRSALLELMRMTRTSNIMYRIATLLDFDIADQQVSMHAFMNKWARD